MYWQAFLRCGESILSAGVVSGMGRSFCVHGSQLFVAFA